MMFGSFVARLAFVRLSFSQTSFRSQQFLRASWQGLFVMNVVRGGVTLEQFEDAVGWRLSACIEPPERLLEDMTVDGLQWLCRELHIDWRRVFLSYDHDA